MGNDFQYTFTVFTPTYNRAHTLSRVYCSLKRQTYSSFEWLIIDDGSSDHTAELVSSWKNEGIFEIRYYRQENAGKHVAINHGVRLAKGELFLIADSDDAFVSTALERFYFHWNGIAQSVRPQFSAVTCHCLDDHGNLIGKRFPHNPTDSNSEEMFYRFKVTDEKWGFQKTEVLKQFPFPGIRTNYFPEAYIWNRIAKKYKARFVNEGLRIYYQDAGGQIMKQSMGEIVSRRFFYADSLNISSEWFIFDPIRFIKTGAQYVRLCLWGRDGVFAQWKRLSNTTAKCIWFIALIPGWFLWVFDGYRRTRNSCKANKSV